MVGRRSVVSPSELTPFLVADKIGLVVHDPVKNGATQDPHEKGPNRRCVRRKLKSFMT